MQMCVFATIKGKGMTICDYNRQYRFKKSGKSYPTHFVQHRISKTMNGMKDDIDSLKGA